MVPTPMDFGPEPSEWQLLHEQHKENFNELLGIASVLNASEEVALDVNLYSQKHTDLVHKFVEGFEESQVLECMRRLDQDIVQYLQAGKSYSSRNKALEKLLILLQLAKLDSHFKDGRFVNTICSCLRQMNTFAINNPQAAELFIEYVLTKTSDVSSSLPILGKFISLYEGVDLNREVERYRALSLLQFCAEHLAFFSEQLQETPVEDYLASRFVSINFSQNHLALKALLFIKVLVESFPSTALSQEKVLEVLLGANPDADAIQYRGQTFNVTYGSESIFDVFSKRIIYLLETLFRQNHGIPLYYQRMVFQYLGLARAVVDLFLGKTNSEFGQLATASLNEPWSRSPPEVSRVLLLLIGQQSFKDALMYSGYSVDHFPPCNWDNFLLPLVDVLRSMEPNVWKKKFSEFLYRFALSSTFKRGQSAIMEWTCRALADLKEIRFQLKYFDNDTIEKSFPFMQQKLSSVFPETTFQDYQNLFKFIKERIEKEVKRRIDTEFSSFRESLVKLFSHLDVIALNISMALTNQEATFFEIVEEVADFSSPRLEETGK